MKTDAIEIGALKRIIEEVKEYRKLPTNMICGNDIDLVENWILELEKSENLKQKITQFLEDFDEPTEDEDWYLWLTDAVDLLNDVLKVI